MIEDILKINNSCILKNELKDYFIKVSDFLLILYDLKDKVTDNTIDKMSINELKQLNKNLYIDILDSNYEKSYSNPEYSAYLFGKELGQVLCYVYYNCRKSIESIFSKRINALEPEVELFIDIYNMLCNSKDLDSLYKLIIDNANKYNEAESELNILKRIDPLVSCEGNVILNSDFSDLRYLYKYDSYISKREIDIVEFFNSIPEKVLDDMVATYVNGYVTGFEVNNLDIKNKEIVYIYYPIGFEKMVFKAYKEFEKIGLKSVFKLDQPYYTNRQYDYDHRFDYALYYNENFVKISYENTKKACEKFKDILAKFAGPAAIETFGEEKFEPINKEEAIDLNRKQRELNTKATREKSLMISKYLRRNETSFTIIAYPTPEISKDFELIFKETIRLNNLDNNIYKEIQQTIIDVLDKSDYVHIVGMNNNKTNLKVKLVEINNYDKETCFENCVADVNIPLGEVFTSPVLKGTSGKLHVNEVYLEGLKYLDLEIDLVDGMISNYTCKNFDNDKANKKFIKENIMNNHESIPIGEFAIGTNTVAYAMAKKYNIQDKLPILIAEKTGPHFAMGDTCYSMAEENKTYNPNGKEIIAKDNECSILRKTDISKAYFNCHTDITIPYNELGEIAAYNKDGEKVIIIKSGRFVLKGTERLNEPLDDLD